MMEFRPARLTKAVLSVAAAVLLAGQVVLAASPRDSLVVTGEWLAKHISDPDLVLLHVGERAEYDARHLPGARFVSMGEIAVSDRTGKGLVLEMPPPDDLRRRLAALGISDRSRIVVYPGKDWVSPTTRIIFTLDYAGLGDGAMLLDGGMDAWVKEGRAVTSAVPPQVTGALSPLKIRPIVVEADFVRAHLGKPGFAVVDGRAAVFYDGVEGGGSPSEPQPAGHVASAGSLPFTEVFDESNKLRSAEDLKALLVKAGVKPGDTVVGYCHIGQQATAVLFAARTLGYPVLLYDGSFQDWSRHPDFPVENPSKKSQP